MWARILNIILGLYVMIAPALFNFNPALSNSNHIVGPLVITFAVISLWDINQRVRLASIVTGAWLIISAFIFSAPATIYLIGNAVAGLLIIIFALVKSNVKHQYGGGWRSLFQNNPEHMRAAEKK